MYELRFIAGPLSGSRVPLKADTLVRLGRARTNTLQIKDGELSRHHCEIHLQGELLSIQDLGSSNGTFVNGKRVVKAARLSERSRIRVGSSIIEVARPSAARSRRPLMRPRCSICGQEVDHGDQNLRTLGPNQRTIICGACRTGPPQNLRLEGFTFLKPLGEGRTGMVYLALHQYMDREVAVKVVHRGSDRKQVERFLREGRSSARLLHPHIVRVFDVGETERVLYLSMEYVQGEALATRIRRQGQLGVAETVRVGAQIAAGLQHAFEAGIVHRDVSPHNILLNLEEVPKLSDFGLAKPVATSGLSGITAPGTSLGTLSYMAPEQMRNALDADHRSDVYSLGATLYHALRGRPPIEPGPIEQFVQRVFQEDPTPLSQLRPDVPPSLDRVVLCALARDPRHRFESPAQFRTALLQAGGGLA